MKRILSICFILLSVQFSAAQNTYEINGEQLELKKEVDGTLDLYWSIVNNEYRYFVEKDGEFAELLNTQANGDYQEEYKATLAEFTEDAAIETENVKLVLYSLRNFVNRYNKQIDKNYDFDDDKLNLMALLGVFGGITNHNYVANAENEITPVLGFEVEFIDPNLSPRHAASFQLYHTSATSDFEYTSVQLALNYRFYLLNKDAFKFHIDAELMNFYYSERIESDTDGTFHETLVYHGFSLQSPLSFGVGANIRILSGGYITLAYNDFFALALEDNGNFPLNFTVGYKMVL